MNELRINNASAPFVAMCVSFASGALLMVASTPKPLAKEECATYSVDKKIVTSYVLRPPECVPVVEPAKAETVACQKEPPVVAPPDASTELKAGEEVVVSKPRRHRHHRRRYYWR